MKIALYKVCSICLLVMTTAIITAKDIYAQNNNPLIMRLMNYEQVHLEKKYGDIEFPLSDVELITVTGEKMYGAFKFKEKSAPRHPNAEQVMHAYYDVVKNLRGKSIYKGDDVATFRVKSNGKEYWCVIEAYTEGKSYALAVVEKDNLQEADNAREMLSILNSKGELDLYISFATGSAELSKASFQTIGEIAKLMRYAPTMSISIEGHTDNVGAPDRNKKLSKARAESVKAALVKTGLNPKRMQTKGWGQEHPIADNNTDRGRLKNRRVSIVKLK